MLNGKPAFGGSTATQDEERVVHADAVEDTTVDDDETVYRPLLKEKTSQCGQMVVGKEVGWRDHRAPTASGGKLDALLYKQVVCVHFVGCHGEFRPEIGELSVVPEFVL